MRHKHSHKHKRKHKTSSMSEHKTKKFLIEHISCFVFFAKIKIDVFDLLHLCYIMVRTGLESSGWLRHWW